MFGIKIGPINWKNLVENIIVGIISGLLCSYITYKTMRLTIGDILTQLKPTIEKAIDKETIANTITNAIDLKIDKIKKSDSINININQVPNNNQKPKNQIIKTTKPKDSVRKGFFGRLFSKEKYRYE